MARIAAARPGFTAILLRGNFGKSAAMMAGFHEAEGDIVVTMDADLQDDPSEIPAFIEELESGFDLVSGLEEGAPRSDREASSVAFFQRGRAQGVGR